MTQANAEIIEHEGVQYRKVIRTAAIGERVIITEPCEGAEYTVGTVFKIGDVGEEVPSQLQARYGDGLGQYLYRSEYAVLEPLADVTMAKLTDAKPGDTVRIINAEDDHDDGYKLGDVFVVADVWEDAGGVDTTYGIELYARELEVVRDKPALFAELAASLEEAAQLGAYYEGLLDSSNDVVGMYGREKPANETQADSVRQPAHYTQGGVEAIEYIEQVTAGYSDGFVAHCVGTAIKYVSRAPHKHAEPTEDLRKAREYLNFAIARLEAAE